MSADFFLSLSSALLWLISAGAIALLVLGADRVVTGGSRLAAALGMSPIIIGATVVSLGTTSPEACVSVTAAFEGEPGLALGNGVGSIICDTALIFGLSCVLVRLPIDRFVLRRHGWLQLGAGALLTVTLLLLALARGSFAGIVISRPIGVLFVLLLIGYLYLSVRWARTHPAGLEIPKPGKGARPPWLRAVLNLTILAFGLALVLGASHVLIGSVSELCTRYKVPPDVLAVTVVAFGTSLPELATAIAAIVKGHTELLVGNVVGADILNVLFVIGASATAAPLNVPPHFFYLHIPVMMAALIMLRLWIFIGGKSFSRWQGVPLLLLYGAYCVLLLHKFGGST